MKIFRKEKIEELTKHLVNDYIQHESNRLAMITVTRCKLNDKGDYVLVFFTVYPRDKENAALFFLQRSMNEIQHFIRKKAPSFRVPYIKFVTDEGEKNRQRIDELLRESNKNEIVPETYNEIE